MKHLILLLGLLCCATTAVHAGWFFDDPLPPPDLGPEYRAKISSLEEQIAEQHATTNRWEVATGTLALGCVLLFVIGTALGAKTRQHHDATRRLGRSVPNATATVPASANGSHHHLGEAGPPDRHSLLAA